MGCAVSQCENFTGQAKGDNLARTHQKAGGQVARFWFEGSKCENILLLARIARVARILIIVTMRITNMIRMVRQSPEGEVTFNRRYSSPAGAGAQMAPSEIHFVRCKCKIASCRLKKRHGAGDRFKKATGPSGSIK